MKKATFNRTQRIGDDIQKELSFLFRQEFTDSRLKFLTITSVKISKDLAYADIYLTQLDAALSKEEMLTLVRRASKRLRYSLAQKMRLRIVPELRFFYDETLAETLRLRLLIDETVMKDETKKNKSE